MGPNIIWIKTFLEHVHVSLLCGQSKYSLVSLRLGSLRNDFAFHGRNADVPIDNNWYIRSILDLRVSLPLQSIRNYSNELCACCIVVVCVVKFKPFFLWRSSWLLNLVKGSSSLATKYAVLNFTIISASSALWFTASCLLKATGSCVAFSFINLSRHTLCLRPRLCSTSVLCLNCEVPAVSANLAFPAVLG